jgi:hypothetical protein
MQNEKDNKRKTLLAHFCDQLQVGAINPLKTGMNKKRIGS